MKSMSVLGPVGREALEQVTCEPGAPARERTLRLRIEFPTVPNLTSIDMDLEHILYINKKKSE